jgi:hypothetical protein
MFPVLYNRDSNESIPISQFTSFFSQIFGWSSTIICSIGIIFNLFIISIIRTSKSETNLILIFLGISDLFKMIFYLPFSICYQISSANSYPNHDNSPWKIYSIIHFMVSVTCNTSSVWLTVYLAFYRCIYMTNSVDRIKGTKNEKKEILVKYFLKRCRTTIFFIFILSFIICIPSYLYPSVNHTFYSDRNNTKTENLIYNSDLKISPNGFIYRLMFISQAILGKIIPSILLVIFVSVLVYSLTIVKKNSRRISTYKQDVKFL